MARLLHRREMNVLRKKRLTKKEFGNKKQE
jgi:hypothetical protein